MLLMQIRINDLLSQKLFIYFILLTIEDWISLWPIKIKFVFQGLVLNAQIAA